MTEHHPSSHWTRRIFPPLCILAIAISAILLSKLETIKAAEHWTSDWRTVWFSDRKDTQDSSVALVLITEETLADSPVRIPIDRHLMAKVIRAVASAHPAAIGIDFVFARPTDPAADADLLSAIKDADVPIILGSVDERMRLPQKQLDYYRQFLEAAGRPTGHLYFERRNNLIGISDHVVREMPEDIDGHKSFAEVLARFKRQDAEPHTRRIAWLLPPRDGSETFYEVDAQDLLGAPEDTEPLLEGLTGKVVLIGSDLNDMDRHLTPLSVVDETRLPGVKIHAQIVAQLIDDRWVREFYLPEELLMLLALGAAGYAMSRHNVLGNFTKLVASSGSVALILAGFASFKLFGIILPYATALSAWVGSIGLSERIDRTYDQLASMWRFVRIEGRLRWQRVYRLGFTLGSRYWRGRL